MRRAQYRINRASLQAQRATDAGIFVDDCYRDWLSCTEVRVGRCGGFVEQLTQRLNGGLTAGRTLVQIGSTGK